MKVHEFLFAFVKKQGSMSPGELDDLKLEAQADYNRVREGFWDAGQRKFKEQGKTVKDLKFWEKVIYYSEQWPLRLGLAVLFPFINAWLQSYFNPPADDDAEYVEI